MQFDYRRAWSAPRVGSPMPRKLGIAAAGAANWPAVALAAALAALALSLRLRDLEGKPLWFDEILTWDRAKLPLGELLSDALSHKHFPTYFLLLRPFVETQSPEWTLRLPSVVFGTICVVLVAKLATDARGLIAGLVAGLLAALAPLEVQFSQEARPYALISCLVLIAACGLARLACNSGSAAATTPTSSRRGAWTAYTLGTLGALLVENNTIPWLVASNLAILVIVRQTGLPQRRQFIRNWAWSQALILVCWLPALGIMVWANRGAASSGLEWVPKITWDSFQSIIGAVYLFRISDLMTFKLFSAPLPGFGAAIALLALFGAWRLRSHPALLAVIGLAFVAMPATVLLGSAFQPLLVPRYILWSTGPFFALAGIGAAALPMNLSAATAVFIAIGGAISLAPYYATETKPRWDRAAAYLASNARPGDVIVTDNRPVQFVLTSYAGRFHVSAEVPILSWVPRVVPQQVANAQRVWAVYGRVGQGVQQPEGEFRQKWSALAAPTEQDRFGSSILLLRFDIGLPTQPPPCCSAQAGPE
jgi:mannosyltransferase